MTSAKIKILILSHSSELAGAELSMLDIFAYWMKKDLIEPHFIIRRPLKVMSKELRKRGWNYTPLYYTNWSNRIPYPKRRAEDIYRSALFNTKAIFNIEKLIQEIKPDVVMTNTVVSPWAAIAAHFQRVPHVWFVREYGNIDNRHNFDVGLEGMFADIDRLSALVATNSRTLANHVSKYVNKEKLTTIYTPFDLKRLKDLSLHSAQNPFKDKDSLKLVITGRIAPTKGQADAAEATARLLKRGYNVELCIIGEPSEPADADPLQQIIDRYNIADKVHLLGQQANPLAFLKYADVGIMASIGEAFGRVTFEYMALGLAVVGANSGATPEMVKDNETGYLYEHGNVKSLTTQLINYAKNRDLVKLHAKNASAKAKQMMKSKYNADALYLKLMQIVKNKDQYITQPLNYAHRWLEYPWVTAKYIKDSGAVSIPRILYHRMRHRAKWAYLTTARVVNFARRGFRRSSTLNSRKKS